MSTTSALDELLGAKKPPRRNGCPVCGEKNVVNVAVHLRELGEGGRIEGRSKTVGRSMCAAHGIEAYQRAVKSATGES